MSVFTGFFTITFFFLVKTYHAVNYSLHSTVQKGVGGPGAQLENQVVSNF